MFFGCDAGEVVTGSYCALDVLPVGASVTATLVATPIANPAPEERHFQTTAFIAESATLDPEPSNNTASLFLEISDAAASAGVSAHEGPSLAALRDERTGIARFVFALPGSEPHIELSIFDVRGRRIAIAASGAFGPGTHTVDWDPEAKAAGIARGVYLVQLRTRSASLTRRLPLLH
jgi:hypothetical protein